MDAYTYYRHFPVLSSLVGTTDKEIFIFFFYIYEFSFGFCCKLVTVNPGIIFILHHNNGSSPFIGPYSSTQ